MRKTRFSDEKIVRLLQEHEAGRKTEDLCREYGISPATFYRWKSKFGGMDLAEVKRLKTIEEENRRLKQLVAEQALGIQALKAVLREKH